MSDLKMHYLVIFNRKSGKIIQTLSGLSSALLSLYAVQGNLKKTQDAILFDIDGTVVKYFEGTGDFPNVIAPENHHIDDYCPGLLEYYKNNEKVNGGV